MENTCAKEGEVSGDWRTLHEKEFSDLYEGVSKSFQTGCPESELQMVQLCH